MAKNHLKRYATPKTWGLPPKATVFVTKANPGSQRTTTGMPISAFLKMHGYAHTAREVKTLLTKDIVLVDQRRVRNARFPVGLLDTIRIPSLNKAFIILFNTQRKLHAYSITDDAAQRKLCKLEGKRILGGDKTQLNLSGGRNALVQPKSKEAGAHVGDSIIITLPSQQIQGVLPLSSGAHVYLIGGKHMGSMGTVTHINGEMLEFTSHHGEKIKTLTKYALATDSDFAHIIKNRQNEREVKKET